MLKRYYYLVLGMIGVCIIGNVISFFSAAYLHSCFEHVLNITAASLALIYIAWVIVLRIQKHKRHERINQLLDKN